VSAGPGGHAACCSNNVHRTRVGTGSRVSNLGQFHKDLTRLLTRILVQCYETLFGKTFEAEDLHAFCLKCLAGYFKGKCPGDEVEVPCLMRRKEFQIPSNGLAGLQHHFFVQHFGRRQNASSTVSRQMKWLVKCV